MDGETARKLVPPDRGLGFLAATVEPVPDEALRRGSDRAVGGFKDAIARDVVLPIERLRPAMRPSP